MIIEVNSIFGKVIAKPLQLVDIHDVQPMADEESIEISESNSDNTKISEVAPEQTPSATEDSSINIETDSPTDKQ